MMSTGSISKHSPETQGASTTLSIHTEMIWTTYPLILDLIKNFRTTPFVLTPANYDYAKAFLGFRGSKEKFSNELTEKYKELARYAKIELHLHIALFPETLSLNDKRKIIEEALSWGKEHGFEFKQIVFGWWKYDSECMKLCEEMGLKIVERGTYPHIHDYDLLFFKKHIALSRALKTKSTTLFTMKFALEQARWFLFFLRHKALRRYLSTCLYM